MKNQSVTITFIYACKQYKDKVFTWNSSLCEWHEGTSEGESWLELGNITSEIFFFIFNKVLLVNTPVFKKHNCEIIIMMISKSEFHKKESK